MTLAKPRTMDDIKELTEHAIIPIDIKSYYERLNKGEHIKGSIKFKNLDAEGYLYVKEEQSTNRHCTPEPCYHIVNTNNIPVCSQGYIYKEPALKFLHFGKKKTPLPNKNLNENDLITLAGETGDMVTFRIYELLGLVR